MIRPRASWLLVLALVAPAQADRQAEDWLGTWTGKATWTGCTVEGASTISLAITWRDHGIFLDGAALYEGLGELAPEGRDDGGLALDLKDLSLALKRTKAKKGAARASLNLRTAAQCTLTASLTRAGSGIAACDDVIALATLAAGCGVTVDDDPADEVEAWQALTGKKAKRAAKACGTRATALRERLVASDCLAPENDPSAIPECTETWALGQKLFGCQRLSAERQRTTLDGVNRLRADLRALHDRAGAHDTAIAACKETTEILRDVADAYGCL